MVDILGDELGEGTGHSKPVNRLPDAAVKKNLKGVFKVAGPGKEISVTNLESGQRVGNGLAVVEAVKVVVCIGCAKIHLDIIGKPGLETAAEMYCIITKPGIPPPKSPYP